MDVISLAGVTARVFGVLIGLPIGEGLQTLPRLFIAVCFAMAISSGLPLPPELPYYGLIPEFLIGLLIAAPILVLAEAASMFGEMLDTARGQTIGSILDPLNGQQVSDLATIVKTGMVVLALSLGGLEACVTVLRESYQYFPLGAMALGEEFLLDTLRRMFGVITSTLTFSSIWLVAYLVIDLSCVLLARVLNGMYFSSTATVVKMIVTFLLLLQVLRESGEVREFAGKHIWASGFRDELAKPETTPTPVPTALPGRRAL